MGPSCRCGRGRGHGRSVSSKPWPRTWLAPHGDPAPALAPRPWLLPRAPAPQAPRPHAHAAHAAHAAATFARATGASPLWPPPAEPERLRARGPRTWWSVTQPHSGRQELGRLCRGGTWGHCRDRVSRSQRVNTVRFRDHEIPQTATFREPESGGAGRAPGDVGGRGTQSSSAHRVWVL